MGTSCHPPSARSGMHVPRDGLVSELTLEQTIDAWLPVARRQIVPRFPSRLEAAFQADHAASRLLALRVGAVVGTLSGILVLPSVWRLMPDAHAAFIWLWCLGGLGTGIVSSLMLSTRLPMVIQEGQTAIAAVVVGGWFTATMVSTHFPQPAVYLGGMLLLIMLDVAAGGFRFPVAAPYGVVVTAMFGFGLWRMAGSFTALDSVLLLMMASCTGFALFGCWRVESETRHSYARMLRERLQQKALSARNAELDELTLRDPLTGLANRRAYQIWQTDAWAAAETAGMPVGLVMVDIDHFKKFNDYYGHPAGDGCLQAVARCMAEQLRGTTDLVARLGGEEFAVLLPGVSLAAASDVAERLRSAIEAMELPHAGCGAGDTVTISCGASATAALPGITLEDLNSAADVALYEAKQAGRNRVCLGERFMPASSCLAQGALP